MKVYDTEKKVELEATEEELIKLWLRVDVR